MISAFVILVIAAVCPLGTQAQGWEQYDFSFLTEWYATTCCEPLIQTQPGETVVGVVKPLPRSPAQANAMEACKEICENRGMSCEKALKIYPNSSRRIDLGLPDPYYKVYQKCNSKYANVCCCVRED